MRACFLSTLLLAATACAGDDGPPLAGGEASIDDRSADAFSFPAPNLTAEELERHFEGDVAFEAVFVSPPSPVNAGLGPLFNHTSCAGCHLRDGRGMPVAGDPRLGSHMIVRISVTAGQPVMPRGPVPVPGLGGQLLTPDGELNRFVNVYVNGQDVRYLEGLATPVGERDEVRLLPAMAGG